MISATSAANEDGSAGAARRAFRSMRSCARTTSASPGSCAARVPSQHCTTDLWSTDSLQAMRMEAETQFGDCYSKLDDVDVLHVHTF